MRPVARHVNATCAPSLARTVFFAVLAFAITAVAITAVALVSISYHAEEQRSEQALVSQARLCANALEGKSEAQQIKLLSEQISSTVRFTFVRADGSVAYDSAVPNGGFDDHLSRPEVLAAKDQGESTIVRRSSTLHQDTLYVAERLDGGAFLRLSEERMSLVAFLGSMALPVCVALGSAVILVVLLSRLLTRRIMKPLDQLDLSDPLAGDAYEEMRPLLARMQDQQRQLRSQNEELKRAEDARREFSSNVSHEMKTPLQVISGYSEMIGSGMAAPEDVPAFAGKINDEARRLRSLINDILTLSRLDEPSLSDGPTTPVELLSVVERIRDRLAPLAEEAGITLTATGEPLAIEGSEPLLEHAVANLMENALRYNEPGGTVHVSVLSADDGCALVRVADTGIGIPEEDQPKVFERFYRADKSRSKETGGTGLGLAIVKHAALRHGGEVQLESSLGEGSCFTLRIPRQAAGQDAANAKADQAG